MNRLSEETLAKMPLHRLKNIRRGVLAHINKCETDGRWCCDMKCEWVKDPDYSYPQKDEDYAYRDLVNKYYDRQVGALVALVEMSQADVAAGRTYTLDELKANLQARRG